MVSPIELKAQHRKIWRVGFLGSGRLDLALPVFRRRMIEQGYVEGSTYVLDVREARGQFDLLPQLMKEIMNGGPDVIVAEATPAIAVAQHATSTIPIVMAPSTDPVGSGFVESFAHPGGNITGFANMFGDLAAKSLEMLRLVVPSVKRIAVLMSANPTHQKMLELARGGADRLGLTLFPFVAPAPADLERAFSGMKETNCEAVYVLADPFRPAIAKLAAEARLPSIYQYSLFVDIGGLMSYGPNILSIFDRAAVYVDKIIKGARPADLPVEQPERFELVLNLKAAKALGLSISPSAISLADKVLE
ncbi:ABC transporter substrate-binding protein [Bradyrhizobium guangzhouense]|nr:ABC transporter substrate-binding protein [Bradyrhizobium guangzhouense]